MCILKFFFQLSSIFHRSIIASNTVASNIINVEHGFCVRCAFITRVEKHPHRLQIFHRKGEKEWNVSLHGWKKKLLDIKRDELFADTHISHYAMAYRLSRIIIMYMEHSNIDTLTFASISICYCCWCCCQCCCCWFCAVTCVCLESVQTESMAQQIERYCYKSTHDCRITTHTVPWIKEKKEKT